MSKANTSSAGRELTMQDRRGFLKLPIEERRRRMEEQAIRLVRYYRSKWATKEREAWQGRGVVEPG